MEGALLAVSTAEVVVTLTVATTLFLGWLYTLFVLIVDDISFGAKVAWFFPLVLLIPISVPTYLFLRHRRHAVGRATST